MSLRWIFSPRSRWRGRAGQDAQPNARNKPRLRLVTLEDRDVPASLVASSDAGAPPEVRVFDAQTQTLTSDFLAYDGTFLGGVRVATGDVNGDGTPDLITAPGPTGGPQIKVFNGKDGTLLSSFMAYASSFTGGVYVAAADVDGDGRAEIITGAGGGGGPQVNVFDGSGRQLASFMAYSTNFLGGVRVAGGDLNGDGKAEIITAPGTTGGPQVNVFALANGIQSVSSFMAFAPNFTGGVNIAAGDINGDGRAEIIAGAGLTGGPQVTTFTESGSMVSSFFAYDPSFQGGVRVAAADVNGDGRAEVVTGAGPTGGPIVGVFDGLSGNSLQTLAAFPNSSFTGIFVAASSGPLNVPSTPAATINNAFNNFQTVVVRNQPILFPFGLGFGAFPFFGFPFFGSSFFGPGLFGYGLGGLNSFGLGGFGGLGGFAPTFFDAPGLFAPPATVFNPGFFGAGLPVAPAADPFAPGGFISPGSGPFTPGGVISPGGSFTDPGAFGGPGFFGGSFTDPGFSDAVAFNDPTAGGFSDFGGGGFSDFGGGGFSDFGGGFGGGDFGGGDF